QRAAAAAVTVREREEARLEGELRASVGEYGDEKWEELRDRLDSELAGLIEERDSLDTELREMREIFAQAAPVDAGARAADSPPVAESPAPGLADAAPVEPDPVQPNTVPPVANSAIAAPESAEMLNDLRSTGARQDAIAAEERSHPRTAAEDPLGELGYLAPSPGGAAVGQSSGEGTTSEAAKTLRCQECHAMNYPTEWYCERCGGEL